MRYALLAVTFLTLSPTSRASLWDDETLAADAKGLPDLVRIITGRFERNPPLYYEMRLSRAAAQIKAQPDNLAAYDVAGVACDQLGRGDEAIAWMEQKNLQMATMVRIRGQDARGPARSLLSLSGQYRHLLGAPLGTSGGRPVADRRGQDGARPDREGDRTAIPTRTSIASAIN